jgi:hypothetical protein
MRKVCNSKGFIFYLATWILKKYVICCVYSTPFKVVGGCELFFYRKYELLPNCDTSFQPSRMLFQNLWSVIEACVLKASHLSKFWNNKILCFVICQLYYLQTSVIWHFQHHSVWLKAFLESMAKNDKHNSLVKGCRSFKCSSPALQTSLKIYCLGCENSAPSSCNQPSFHGYFAREESLWHFHIRFFIQPQISFVGGGLTFNKWEKVSWRSNTHAFLGCCE